eukprot:3238525-Pyramimonas_sp.AAC.1
MKAKLGKGGGGITRIRWESVVFASLSPAAPCPCSRRWRTACWPTTRAPTLAELGRSERASRES